MTADNPFRLALVIVIILTMAVVVYHRRQAAASGDRISYQQEGYLFAILLRLAGFCLWISTVAYLVWPASVQWATVSLPHWVRWIGVAGGVICSFLMYWTLSSLGNSLTDTVAIRSDATLVEHGPYHWVRHPYYVTAALLMASVTVLTANWLIGICCLVVLAMLAVRTPKEEQMLIERFGQQYRDYMARTGRFFPRVFGRG